MVYEDIPRVSKRLGDSLIAGANNATILLGRDRIGSVDSGYGSSSSANGGRDAGAIHAIVGRKSEDPSIANDAATLYISTITDPDVAASTTAVGSGQTGKSGVILRADCVRIVPRVDIKLSVGKAYIWMTADGRVEIDGEISLTKGAANSIVRGEPFQSAYMLHTHLGAAPGTPTGPVIQSLPPSVFNKRVRC